MDTQRSVILREQSGGRMTQEDVACWAVKGSLRSKLYLKFVFKISFITGCRADLLVEIIPPLRSLKMTMQDVAPKGQKSTGRGVSPCYWFVRKQSAEGATVPVFLLPFQGCHAGVSFCRGFTPACALTPLRGTYFVMCPVPCGL